MIHSRRRRRTRLAGSLGDHVYGFAASTGEPLWSFGTRGCVYASPALWRNLVLIGSLVDEWRDGEYSPVVAAGRRLCLVCVGRLYVLAPR